MALIGVDFNRAVFTHPERKALVEAVFSAPPGEPEKDFIKWKSGYDLRSPEDQCKLARHILGFANRNPDQAANVFGGSAYLICGVEPGDSNGVEKLDAADLVQGIGRYTGTAAGPRWDFDYVDQGGRDVLVITIERPLWGDPIRTLQKGFGAYVAGMVFIRRHGKTEQADPSEIRMLELRSARHKQQLELAVTWSSSPQPVLAVGWSQQELTNWGEQERDKLLEPLARHQVAGTTGLFGMLYGETRTPEEYRAQVDEYVKVASDALPLRLLLKAAERAHRYRLEIQNLTERNFEATRLELVLRGGAFAYFDLSDARFELKIDRLPTRPNLYGIRRDFLGSAWKMPYIPSSFVAAPPVGWIENKQGGVHIRFADQDVRPRGSATTVDWLLIAAGQAAGKAISIEWSATAKNTEGRVEGELQLPVDAEMHGIGDLLDSADDDTS